jgi:hypothetical protein
LVAGTGGAGRVIGTDGSAIEVVGAARDGATVELAEAVFDGSATGMAGPAGWAIDTPLAGTGGGAGKVIGTGGVGKVIGTGGSAIGVVGAAGEVATFELAFAVFVMGATRMAGPAGWVSDAPFAGTGGVGRALGTGGAISVVGAAGEVATFELA